MSHPIKSGVHKWPHENGKPNYFYVDTVPPSSQKFTYVGKDEDGIHTYTKIESVKTQNLKPSK